LDQKEKKTDVFYFKNDKLQINALDAGYQN